MSYKIAKSRALGHGLKSVAAREIEAARRALSRKAAALGKAGGNGLDAVHEARRHFKRMRGLLRLVRRGLGRKGFSRENVFFRDAGRKIRAARDGVALIEALDGLSHRAFKGDPPAIVGRLRRLLVRDAQRLAEGIVLGRVLARTSRDLEAELDRVKAWELKDFTWKDARKAWRNGRRRCRRAFEAAHAEPTDENLHEWRKRAKILWQETLLLRKGCPEHREQMRDVKALGLILGEDRDLAMLKRAARMHREEIGLPDQWKALMEALTARRSRLRVEAFELGGRRKV